MAVNYISDRSGQAHDNDEDRITLLENTIASLQLQVTTLSNLNLDTRLTSLESYNINNRLNAVENAISILNSRFKYGYMYCNFFWARLVVVDCSGDIYGIMFLGYESGHNGICILDSHGAYDKVKMLGDGSLVFSMTRNGNIRTIARANSTLTDFNLVLFSNGVINSVTSS